MGRVTNTLKEHVWCVVIIACIVTIAITALGFAGRLDVAGALVSIVLGVVVIIYTFRNSERMQELIYQIPGVISKQVDMIAEKASAMTEHAESMEKTLASTLESFQAPIDLGREKKPLEDKNFKFDCSGCSALGLLGFYCIAKSDEHGTKVDLGELAKLLYSAYHPKSQFAATTFLKGLAQTTDCFLLTGTIKREDDTIKASNLPPSFAPYIRKTIDNRYKHPFTDRGANDLFLSGVPIIDQYFAKAT